MTNLGLRRRGWLAAQLSGERWMQVQSPLEDLQQPVDDPFASLYVNVWPRLVRRMSSILRDHAAAEEASQEAILRLAIEIRAGRAPDNPDVWLSRVALNVAISQIRRRQVASRHAPQLLQLAPRASVEDGAIERERFGTMRRALAELEPTDRLIVMLAASGHSGLEIARRVGGSHAAVRTRLHRIRARLRARVGQLEVA